MHIEPRAHESEILSAVTPGGSHLRYIRLGNGPALVICHGSFSSSLDWLEFAKHIAPRRSVYLYDRRGRGRNADVAASYSLATELDDLAGVMTAAGGKAVLLGHSFGGGCALMYSLHSQFSGQLILYEPAHSVVTQFSECKLPTFRSLLDTDRGAATAYCLEHLAGVDPHELVGLKSSPMWPRLVELASTFCREVAVMDTITPSALDLATSTMRTSLLLGESSGENSKRHTLELVERLRSPALVPVRGHGHSAHLTGPAHLAKIVLRCLEV